MLEDITRTLNNKTKIYPGDPEFQLKQLYSLNKDGFNLNSISMGTHTGTHIDTPSHFIRNGKTTSQLDMSFFITNAYIADVSALVSIEPSFLRNIELKNVDSLLFKTKNKNIFLSFDGAKYLLSSGLKIIGTEEMDIENENNNSFPVHKLVLKNDIFILENLNLERVVQGYYKLYCFPLLIENADASPVRAVIETG